MDSIAKHFPAQNALYCRILHIKTQIFTGVVPPYLRSKHQFPLRSPAFPLVLFYETTTYTLTYSFQYVTHVSLKHNTSLTDDDLI